MAQTRQEMLWGELLVAVDEKVVELASERKLNPDELRRKYVMACIDVVDPRKKQEWRLAGGGSRAQNHFSVTPAEQGVGGVVGGSELQLDHEKGSMVTDTMNSKKYSCDLDEELDGVHLNRSNVATSCDLDEELEGANLDCSNVATDGSVSKKSPRTESSGKEEETSGKSATTTASSVESFIRATSFARQKILDPVDVPVRILKVSSPKEIFVGLVNEEKQGSGDYFSGIPVIKEEKLMKLTEPLSSNKVRKGRLCAVKTLAFGGKKAWGRGRVEEVMETESRLLMHVRLVDSGHLIENLPVSKVKPLPAAYSEPAPLAFRCTFVARLPSLIESFVGHGMLSVLLQINRVLKVSFNPLGMWSERGRGQIWPILQMKVDPEGLGLDRSPDWISLRDVRDQIFSANENGTTVSELIREDGGKGRNDEFLDLDSVSGLSESRMERIRFWAASVSERRSEDMEKKDDDEDKKQWRNS